MDLLSVQVLHLLISVSLELFCCILMPRYVKGCHLLMCMELMRQYVLSLLEAEFIHHRISENIHILAYLHDLYCYNTVNCTPAGLNVSCLAKLWQHGFVTEMHDFQWPLCFQTAVVVTDFLFGRFGLSHRTCIQTPVLALVT